MGRVTVLSGSAVVAAALASLIAYSSKVPEPPKPVDQSQEWAFQLEMVDKNLTGYRALATVVADREKQGKSFEDKRIEMNYCAAAIQDGAKFFTENPPQTPEQREALNGLRQTCVDCKVDSLFGVELWPDYGPN